jgi:Bacterial type III secretion protein (HrpB7)
MRKAAGYAGAVSTPQLFRKLLRVKRRRVDQLAEAREAARAFQQQCRQAQEAAQREEDERQQAENTHRDKTAALSRRTSFRASDLITMNLIGDGLALETRAAQKATHQAQQTLDAAGEALAQATLLLQRGEQQLLLVQERLAQSISDADNAAEDAQDEESEETVVARLVARSRAASALAA